MQINGVELEIRMGNAAFAERYESAFQVFKKSRESIAAAGSASGVYRQITGEVEKLFDTIFGEGTYQKIKLDRDELFDNLDAVALLDDESERQIQSRMNKYAPNRAQRRAKK